MFRSSDEILDARAEIFQQFRKKEITPEIAIQRLCEREPRSPLALAIEADLLREAGDVDRAEEALWSALAGAPCGVGPLFNLAAIRDKRGGDAASVLPFRLLGLRQIAASDEVPDDVARNFEVLGKAAKSPEAYELLAERTKEALGDAPWPEKLTPFRLLTEVEESSITGLDPDLLHKIFEEYDVCEPVFRAALRQWADDEAPPLSDESASLLLAILGERGGPELVDDIMPDEQYPTSETLLHAQWAVRRLGQRHPAEAFERLQALAATADLTARGLLAEQFYFLPEEIRGRKEAILRLLDDFPAADDPDEAAYFLVTVASLMEMLGSPADARAVIEKYRRRLSPKARRSVTEALEGDEPFVPNLSFRGIENLTIEDVVVDLSLMDLDEEHDHDEDEFDDEDRDVDDDYVEPVVAEPRPGRNDPCWCGSGKKYKKCHLAEDEESARAASSSSTDAAEFTRVVNEITETAVSKMNRPDAAEASRLFFDREPGLLDLGEDEQTAFLQWMTLDFRCPSTGRTAIEEYLRRRGGPLPEKDRALVEGIRNARYGLWEVQRVEKGKGVEVKDYFGSDERLFVSDISCSKQASQWDCIIAYFFENPNGRWEFFADGINVPRTLVPRIAEMVETGSRAAKMPPSEYFRSRSHEWRRLVAAAGKDWISGLRVANSEGDEVEFSKAFYEVEDAQAVEAALLAGPVFAPAGPGRIAWLDSPAAPAGSIFGSIEIADGKLTLDCNSRKRLKIGRQLVEKHAGKFLRFAREEFHSMDEVKQAAFEGRVREPAPSSGLPPELERELTLKFKEQHYATWADHPLPALGGQTPREAARSKSGRRAVEDLLRDMQNHEEREQRAGRAAFDFGAVRKDLGL